MMHYALRCRPAAHEFDGWFRSSGDFDGQVERGLVACPACASTAVEKAMMRPAVSGIGQMEPASESTRPVANVPGPAELAALMGKLQAMSRAVRAKAENVGPRFAEEARRIHFGEVEERQIYGAATRAEVERLAEDGIPALPLPPLPEDAN